MVDYIIVGAGLLLLVWFIYEACNPAECTDPFCCPRNEYPEGKSEGNVVVSGSWYDGIIQARKAERTSVTLGEIAGFVFKEDPTVPPGYIRVLSPAEVPDKVWRSIAEQALAEQGAAPQYIEKVKQELCGPFGRVMP